MCVHRPRQMFKHIENALMHLNHFYIPKRKNLIKSPVLCNSQPVVASEELKETD